MTHEQTHNGGSETLDTPKVLSGLSAEELQGFADYQRMGGAVLAQGTEEIISPQLRTGDETVTLPTLQGGDIILQQAA